LPIESGKTEPWPLGCGGQESGAPYDSRWRTITAEAFEVVLVLLSLTLFNEALAALGWKRQRRAETSIESIGIL